MVLGPSKARAGTSDWDLECVSTVHVDGSGPLLPDVNQSVVQDLRGHLGLALDEV